MVDSVSEPVPISLIGGRYLLFDVNVVTYLRSTHHICGSLVGTIAQAPQQNLFLGLPVELMPEEAKLLVQKEIAYIVDDTAWHANKFSTFSGEEKQKYIDSLRAIGMQAKNAAQKGAKEKQKDFFARKAVQLAEAKETAKKNPEAGDAIATHTTEPSGDSLLGDEDSFFSEGSRDLKGTAFESSTPWAVTSTTTSSVLPQNPIQQPDPPVPSSYPLFAHLHSRGYFIMPGLRFGCNYNVYPGDPLRFHSHFLAVGYDWDEEISMLDLIGGGRLGTAVKKGFLIGAEDPEGKADEDNVRTFALEWGGM